MNYDLFAIIGPTAVGKTKLAVALAADLNGEIISADSRQLYRGMDLGSGKDLEEYVYKGKQIPYHLIDILDAGEKYDLFRFQQDCFEVFRQIKSRGNQAVLCGGTGMYIQAALNREKLLEVPENLALRSELDNYSQQELNNYLINLNPTQHNKTDLNDRERTLRAIEIEVYTQQYSDQKEVSPIKNYRIFGIQMPREELRNRIKTRLKERLKAGMIEEVEQLVANGVSHQQLQYYGLEYKFISLYLQNKLSNDEMFDALLQAIRRFAKKQMTWYRRMEKQGFKIDWIDAKLPLEEKLKFILSLCAE
ncbi:MAG: tRNA (adenosine(37)-N6)-dimethylallyltransferase MiaA [Flavobacteriales bacterium]|nr:tRNA (adenosine(37)-N6)-dimethylallyltransferase MiaA [Flavobacteriales bacterium]|tara:strand:- start:34237 stop:35154 length:918 start_codon:yes stop_codon:yes gene_type:complete